MESSWKTTSIGDQVTLQRGIDITRAEQRVGSVPVISSGGISSYHDKAAAKGPGVILGRKGVVGSVWFTNQDYWPHDTTLYVRDFKGNDPRFVYYFFKWKAPTLAALDVGSANPTLNRNHVHPIEIRWPEIQEQRRIAGILGVLDDKVELIRKMNETLEQMARALFKSWFIDFDPVRARAAGKQPSGMDEATAALFPDSFEKSEMGEIPRGWNVSQIKALTSNIQYGFTTSADPNPVGPKFLRITDIQGGQCSWPSVPHCQATPSELAKYQLKNGDVVVARTGASTGENMLIVDPPEAVFASYLVRFQFPKLPLAVYVASFMRSPDYFSYVAGILGGSAQPNANAQQLSEAKLVVADEKTVSAFYAITRPLFELVRANMTETAILSNTRDLLLPRLLSGELAVKGQHE